MRVHLDHVVPVEGRRCTDVLLGLGLLLARQGGDDPASRVGVRIYNTHPTNAHPLLQMVWGHEQPFLSLLPVLPVLSVLGLPGERLRVGVLIGGSHGFVVLVLLVLGEPGQSPGVSRDITHVEQLVGGLNFSRRLGESVVVGVVLGLWGIQRVRIGSG